MALLMFSTGGRAIRTVSNKFGCTLVQRLDNEQLTNISSNTERLSAFGLVVEPKGDRATGSTK
jgi:hypothetical protein